MFPRSFSGERIKKLDAALATPEAVAAKNAAAEKEAAEKAAAEYEAAAEKAAAEKVAAARDPPCCQAKA